MKKILLAITLLVAITSCDDGNISIQELDFDGVQPVKCSDKNLFYQIKDNNALLLLVTDETFNTTFINNETLPDAPRTFAITETSNRVIYRAYDGVVTSSKFCGAITDANPTEREEWIAVSGTAQVTTTTPNKVINASTGIESITNYNHNIVFKNLVFRKPDGILITYDSRIFGDYQTPNTTLPFNFVPENLAKSTCTPSETKLYNITGSEALQLNLDATTYNNLFQSSVTTTPRIAVLNSTNTLIYRLFSSTVTNDYFCSTTAPTTPTVTQLWTAQNGVEGSTGIIEVTTTTSGIQFQHSVHLKNVTFGRLNSSFMLGSNYNLGTFFTN